MPAWNAIACMLLLATSARCCFLLKTTHVSHCCGKPSSHEFLLAPLIHARCEDVKNMFFGNECCANNSSLLPHQQKDLASSIVDSRYGPELTALVRESGWDAAQARILENVPTGGSLFISSYDFSYLPVFPATCNKVIFVGFLYDTDSAEDLEVTATQLYTFVDSDGMPCDAEGRGSSFQVIRPSLIHVIRHKDDLSSELQQMWTSVLQAEGETLDSFLAHPKNAFLETIGASPYSWACDLANNRLRFLSFTTVRIDGELVPLWQTPSAKEKLHPFRGYQDGFLVTDPGTYILSSWITNYATLQEAVDALFPERVWKWTWRGLAEAPWLNDTSIIGKAATLSEMQDIHQRMQGTTLYGALGAEMMSLFTILYGDSMQTQEEMDTFHIKSDELRMFFRTVPTLAEFVGQTSPPDITNSDSMKQYMNAVIEGLKFYVQYRGYGEVLDSFDNEPLTFYDKTPVSPTSVSEYVARVPYLHTTWFSRALDGASVETVINTLKSSTAWRHNFIYIAHEYMSQSSIADQYAVDEDGDLTCTPYAGPYFGKHWNLRFPDLNEYTASVGPNVPSKANVMTRHDYLTAPFLANVDALMKELQSNPTKHRRDLSVQSFHKVATPGALERPRAVRDKLMAGDFPSPGMATQYSLAQNAIANVVIGASANGTQRVTLFLNETAGLSVGDTVKVQLESFVQVPSGFDAKDFSHDSGMPASGSFKVPFDENHLVDPRIPALYSEIVNVDDGEMRIEFDRSSPMRSAPGSYTLSESVGLVITLIPPVPNTYPNQTTVERVERTEFVTLEDTGAEIRRMTTVFERYRAKKEDFAPFPQTTNQKVMFPGPYVDQVEHAAIMSMPLPTDDNLLAPLHLPSDFSKAADDVWTGWTYGADSEYYIWYRFEQYLTPISYFPSDKYSTMGNAGNLDYTAFGAEREQWFAESTSVEFVWKTAGAALNSWATEGEVVTLADVQRIHEEMPAVQVYTLSSAPSVSFNQLTAWELIATQSRMDEIVLLYNTLLSATFPNLPSLTSPDILDASQVEDFISKTVVAFLGLHLKSATPPTSVSEYADSVPWLKGSWFEEQVSAGGGGPSPPSFPIQRLSDVAAAAYPEKDPDKLVFMLWRTAWVKPEDNGNVLWIMNIPDDLETLDASNFLWQHGFYPRTGQSDFSFRGGGEGSYYKDITFITKPDDVALPVRTALMAYGYSSGVTSSSIDSLLSTGKAFMFQSFAAEPLPRVYNIFVDLQERRGFNVIVGLQMLKQSEKQPLEDGIALKDEDFLDDVLQMNQQYAAAYEEAVNNGLKPEFPAHLMVAGALANGALGNHEWFTANNPNNVDGLLESWNDYLSIYGRTTTHPLTGETILTQSEPWNTLFTGLGEMREAFLSVPVPEDIFDITTSPVAKYDASTWKLSPAVQTAFASLAPGMDLSSTFTMDQLAALPVGYDWQYLVPVGLLSGASPSQLPVAYPASYSTIDAAVADVRMVALTLATSRAAAHPKSSPPFALSSNATSLSFADFTVCSLHYGFDANVGRQLRPLPGGFQVRYDEPIPAWSFAISKESYANYELSFTLTFTGRLAQSHNWVTAIAPGVAGGIKLGLQSQSQEPVSSHIQLSPESLGTFMLADPKALQVSPIPFPDVGTRTLLASDPTLPLHFVIRMRDGTVQYSINGKQSAQIAVPGPADGHVGFELEFSDFEVTDLSIRAHA